MDSDYAGLKNARKIRDMLRTDPRFKHIRVGIHPPRQGKDYNELLQIKKQAFNECHAHHSPALDLRRSPSLRDGQAPYADL